MKNGLGFAKRFRNGDYEALKPNFLGRLYVLHGTPGSITKSDLSQVLNQGRIMMNRIYAKQSTTTKNAILQEYPKLVAKAEADKKLIHQLQVEQTYHRMMIGVATKPGTELRQDYSTNEGTDFTRTKSQTARACGA